MSEHDDKAKSVAEQRRSERNAPFSEGPDEGSASGSRTSGDTREVTGGAAVVDAGFDGFRQPTAMFDKGEFLGELAELVDGAPATRAKVEAGVKPPLGCRLIIVSGPDLGLEWSFKSKEVVIGRDEDCQLVMQDIAVSRRHARIAFKGDHFMLTDLGSGNGTFLNGGRVQEERLSPGDEIIIGERTLRFVELNEVPVTSAAQPVQPDFQEPVIEDVPDLSQEEPALGASQVERAVESDASPEPAIGSAELHEPDQPPRLRGQALRRAAIVLAGVGAVVVVGLAGWAVYERFLSQESPAQRAQRIKREFLQGIELVKQLRCGDASILFRRVLAEQADHPRVQGYLDHCETQIAHWQHIAAAREMAAARRYIEAIDRLKKVPNDSDYREQAEEDQRVYARSVAYSLLSEAQDASAGSDVDKALELVDRAIELAPDLEEARQLRRQTADATAAPPRPRPRRRTFRVPRTLRTAVSLYEEGKIAAGIDAAEAAGGTAGRAWAERMTTIKKLVTEVRIAHKRKAAAELMRLGPETLALDMKISGGQGKVRDVVSKYYADGLYLKGIERMQSSDDESAYRLLSRAVKVMPDHKLATKGLAELNDKATAIYYDGYHLKDADKAEARRIFERLIRMTSPRNPYHKQASAWLRANR